MMTELWKLLNQEGLEIEKCPIKPEQLAGMLKLVDDGTISGKIAKTVFDEMFRTGKDAGAVVKDKGLVQISDAGEIERAVDEVLAANPGEVERYRGGEEKLMGFFVGQVMKLTKGKANPKLVNELFRKKLG
jgi:aspartyl-tRNA(Asn)/glutamyl-tRNA(Gln) amidotransferase subunit B